MKEVEIDLSKLKLKRTNSQKTDPQTDGYKPFSAAKNSAIKNYFENSTKMTLKKLEEAKARLMEQAKLKKEELVKKVTEAKMQIEAHKTQIEKIRQDVELKKKKIINLKAVAGD